MASLLLQQENNKRGEKMRKAACFVTPNTKDGRIVNTISLMDCHGESVDLCTSIRQTVYMADRLCAGYMGHAYCYDYEGNECTLSIYPMWNLATVKGGEIDISFKINAHQVLKEFDSAADGSAEIKARLKFNAELKRLGRL